MRVSFGGYTEAALYNITQYVMVKPATKYRLTFWLRTEDLKSGGTPKLEVNNGSDRQQHRGDPAVSGRNKRLAAVETGIYHAR